ncbi:MAG: isochorismate synthase [Acidobacteriota bacterium]|nr:isochorismate synthase [Acidobacteriota bacterium]
MSAPASSLEARTVALDEAPDLRACAGSDGLLFHGEDGGVAARGEALRIDLPHGLSDTGALADVSHLLRRISREDDLGLPGTGPLVVGALPFDPSAPGHLVVPEVIYGRRGRQGWVTTIGRPGAGGTATPGGGPPAPAPEPPASPPDRFELVPTMSHAEWKDVVSDAVARIEAGELTKVVLARRIDILANRPFVLSDVLERLGALYPSCMVFSVEGFVGASPELLVRRDGPQVECHPLAGTVARSGDVRGDEILVARLMDSPKIRREHRLVVEAIAAALAPYCEEMDVPEQPSVLGLRNVSHLATRLTGRLSNGQRPSVLELAARIHPTPAVGGLPTEEAIRYIQKVEGFDRGRYAGPVGWMDADGNGSFALGIRSAELDGATARIYAGNGIVAGSDPSDELAETQLKLQALLAALVRP